MRCAGKAGRQRSPPVYGAVAVFVWLATLESGIHSTIAGVVLGLLMPARFGRLEEALNLGTSYVVVPVFALANAGVVLPSGVLADAAGSAVTIGVVLGLVVGKVVGVLGASALAIRLGLARLPLGVRWAHVAGMAALSGIGFTVSIFISGLAFDDVALQDEAKLGVLAASVLAAAAGCAILLRAGQSEAAASPAAVSTRNPARSE